MNNGVVGIANRYSNCFANCAWQILLNLDYVNSEIVKSVNDIGKSNLKLLGERLKRQDQIAIDYLGFYLDLFQQYQTPGIKTVSPEAFYRFLASQQAVKPGQQGDYQEFLLLLLDRLSRAMKIMKMPFTLEDLFEGKTEKQVTCQTCNNRSVTRESFGQISLVRLDIERSVADFVEPVAISGYRCERCNQSSDAIINVNIIKWPIILCFQSVVKQSGSTELSRYYRIPNLESTHNYEVYAVVYHRGSQRGGHYECEIAKDQTIFAINDDMVRTKSGFDNRHIVGIYMFRKRLN